MLEPVFKIVNRNWIDATATQKVMRALNSDDVVAYFVGGCVRNAVTGHPISDIDICTKMTPDQVMKCLEKAGIPCKPTGIDHGTVTAISEKKPFEITTLRKDVETDGRHAVVAYSEDWLEDAKRRDFTMNTLLADMDGHVYDPLGSGYEDAVAGRVRFVGDALERIKEDYLRVLRFFRFYAWYGKGKPDEAAIAACSFVADHVWGLSQERITAEYLKLLSAKRVADVVELMLSHNITADRVCKNFDKEILDALNDPIARIVHLCHQSKEQFEMYSAHLKLSNAQHKQGKGLIEAYHKYENATMMSLKAVLYFYDRIIARQWLVLRQAQDLALLDYAETGDIPVLPIKGSDLLAQGYKEGADLGSRLKEIEAKWIAADFDDAVAKL